MAAEHARRLADYEGQVAQLQETIKGLEEEVVVLRRRLQDAPKRVRTLEERLLETKGQLAQAVSQNEKLSATLREAREHIAALREDVEKLTMPPSGYGTYLGTNDDGTADIFTAGRKLRVAVSGARADALVVRSAYCAAAGAISRSTGTWETSAPSLPVTQCTGASKCVPVCSPVLMSFQYQAGPRSSYRLISVSEKGAVLPNGSGSLSTGVDSDNGAVRSMTSTLASRMASVRA